MMRGQFVAAQDEWSAALHASEAELQGLRDQLHDVSVQEQDAAYTLALTESRCGVLLREHALRGREHQLQEAVARQALLSVVEHADVEDAWEELANTARREMMQEVVRRMRQSAIGGTFRTWVRFAYARRFAVPNSIHRAGKARPRRRAGA